MARGDACLFLRFPAPDYREKIWDHAAGAVIVTEAGGRITDGSGAPLDFGRGRCFRVRTPWRFYLDVCSRLGFTVRSQRGSGPACDSRSMKKQCAD